MCQITSAMKRLVKTAKDFGAEVARNPVLIEDFYKGRTQIYRPYAKVVNVAFFAPELGSDRLTHQMQTRLAKLGILSVNFRSRDGYDSSKVSTFTIVEGRVSSFSLSQVVEALFSEEFQEGLLIQGTIGKACSEYYFFRDVPAYSRILSRAH